MRTGTPSRVRWITGLCLGVLLLTPASVAKTKIKSHWLDREIVIDGEIDEWRDTLVYVNSVDTFVALFNDDSNLYFCLYSQNPATARQLVMDGLRLQIEAKDSEGIRVHFPKGTGRPDPRDRRVEDPAERVPAVSEVIELELPGQRDRVTITSGGETGIEARISIRGSFVYELKIPLVRDSSHPWAPGLFPGDAFKLLVENPQIDTVTDEFKPHGRNRGNNSPFEQGPFGSRNDPGWTGGGVPGDPTFRNRLAFLLKARVELATAPKK